MTKSRKNLLVILSICLILSFATFFVTANHTATADTAGTLNVETILMNDGASVRLKNPNDEDYGNYSGIRFRLYVNQEYYTTLGNPEVGMYIALYNETSESDMCDINSIPENAMFFRAKEFAGDDAETIQETMSFNAVIYDIPVEEYGTKLIANGYIKTESGEVFATNPQIRSLAQTASINIAKGEDADALKDYVDAVVTEDNFKFTNTAIETDLYKTEEPTLGVVAPEDLVVMYNSSDADVVTVDENGNLTRAGKVGSATITATLGSTEITATVTVNEPVILKVNDQTSAVQLSWSANTGLNGVVNATDVDATSEYKGKAQKLQIWNCGSDGFAWAIENPYTEEQLSLIKKDYNRVTMWYAIDIVDSDAGMAASTWLAQPGYSPHTQNNFLNMAGQAAKRVSSSTATNGKWQKATISINDYITLATQRTDGKVLLIATTSFLEGLDTTNSFVYFGDITFEIEVPTHVVDMSVATGAPVNLSWSAGTGNKGIVNATDVDATSEYKGKAQKLIFWNSSGGSGRGWAITNTLTDEDFELIKKKYNSVSMWFAYDLVAAAGQETGSVYFANKGWSTNIQETFVNLAGGAGKRVYTTDANNRKWQKLTITLDKYIELVNSRTDGKVLLFTVGGFETLDADKTSANSFVYFGDIFFENT